MFKGLTESKDFPPGKKMNSLSYSSRTKQFEMGMPEWQQSYVSANRFLHNSKALTNNKANHEGRNQSHFVLKPEDSDPGSYFTSEKTDKYRNNFDKREENKKLNKLEIMKTTFVLGEDVNNYVTHHQTNYYDKSNIKLPDIQWKPQRERWDIITNHNERKERVENACAFDYWNETKDKKRISRNYSQIPKDNEYLDVITGRMKKRNCT